MSGKIHKTNRIVYYEDFMPINHKVSWKILIIFINKRKVTFKEIKSYLIENYNHHITKNKDIAKLSFPFIGEICSNILKQKQNEKSTV